MPRKLKPRLIRAIRRLLLENPGRLAADHRVEIEATRVNGSTMLIQIVHGTNLERKTLALTLEDAYEHFDTGTSASHDCARSEQDRAGDETLHG